MRLDIDKEESNRTSYSQADTEASTTASASKSIRSYYEKIRQELLIKPNLCKKLILSKYFWSTLLYVIYSTGFCLIDMYADPRFRC